MSGANAQDADAAVNTTAPMPVSTSTLMLGPPFTEMVTIGSTPAYMDSGTEA